MRDIAKSKFYYERDFLKLIVLDRMEVVLEFSDSLDANAENIQLVNSYGEELVFKECRDNKIIFEDRLIEAEYDKKRG